MNDITIDVWLYGVLARYGGAGTQSSFSNLQVGMAEGGTVADLLSRLGLPTEERGITFINGQLSAMSGLQPDLGHVLRDGDRVGIFDPKSMWPFQYRHGATITEEMAKAMASEQGGGVHHTYGEQEAGGRE